MLTEQTCRDLLDRMKREYMRKKMDAALQLAAGRDVLSARLVLAHLEGAIDMLEAVLEGVLAPEIIEGKAFTLDQNNAPAFTDEENRTDVRERSASNGP